MRSDVLHLRAAGVSVVIAVGADPSGGLPKILHWGADLGELGDTDLARLVAASSPPNAGAGPDDPELVGVLPSEADGWIGRPGLAGSRNGRDFSPRFAVTSVRRSDPADRDRTPSADPSADPSAGPSTEPSAGPSTEPSAGPIAASVTVTAADPAARLDLAVTIQIAGSGLLRLRAALTNTDPEQDYRLDGLALALPVPPRAAEVFDTAGHHARERLPQRRPFTVGVHARESRQGRPGLDGPLLLAAGVPGFGFETGEVWGIHVGFSGNQQVAAERTAGGEQVLSGGELLLPGELNLGPGESYSSPWLYGSYGDGLSELATRFHTFLRGRPQHPRRPRPVTLNTWEAVYFEHRLDRLTALARAAARVGVERFVLDDGWFRGRRDDHAGLGDWQVDPDVWPDGLHPLIEVVRGLGMEFGLWVEPEMVNLDSDLARAHPGWLLRPGDRHGKAYRHQHVLDLGNPDAYAHIAGCLHALLDEYPIAYLKWDHNRLVTEAGHQPGGEPGVHAQTGALYRLLDEIKAAHPGLEIESCASGGGRIDLGILERTDRVWASDCIDALDRQQIQRYTSLVVPPEMMGAHIGGPVAHTTGRTHHLDLRAGTALFGHLGIEWDLTTASDSDLDEVASWVALHKELRPLLHTGTVVVGDHPDPAVWVHGVVAADRADAVFAVVAIGRAVTSPPGRVRLPGLDPDRTYLVAPCDGARHGRATGPATGAAATGAAVTGAAVTGAAATGAAVTGAAQAPPAGGARWLPPWWSGEIALPGRVLGEVGVQVPPMAPERLALLRCVATRESGRSDG